MASNDLTKEETERNLQQVRDLVAAAPPEQKAVIEVAQKQMDAFKEQFGEIGEVIIMTEAMQLAIEDQA